MNQPKNNLDERQELKLLKIEHNGCWFAFWGLLIAIVIQLVAGSMEVKNVIGEFVVFMSLAVYLVAGCLREGIWDRKLKPTLKTNLVISLIGAAASGAFWFVIVYRDYHSLPGSAAVGGITLVLTFGICMLLLAVASGFYKRRVHKLEDQEE